MKRFLGRENGIDSPEKVAAQWQERRQAGLTAAIDLAIEVWRLQDRVRKLLSATGQDDPSISFSIDKIQHILRQFGIETREYTGQAYNEGMSLDVLTFDYPVDEKPMNRVVQETVSPAIFLDGRLHKMAQVIVGKAGITVDGQKHD